MNSEGGEREARGDKAESSQALWLEGGTFASSCAGAELPPWSSPRAPLYPCQLRAHCRVLEPALPCLPRETRRLGLGARAPGGEPGLAARRVYEGAASGPVRLTWDVFKLTRSFSKHLPSGPRRASRPSPQQTLEEGVSRASGGREPGSPAPAQEAREAKSRPRRGRPRARPLLLPQAERRAAQPTFPEAASQPETLLEGRESYAAMALVFRWPPGLLIQGQQGSHLSRLPGGAELGRPAARTPAQARPCHVAPQALYVPAPTAF